MKGWDVSDPKTCFVVISNTVDDAFEDLVLSLRRFCPSADIAWYNSGVQRETPFGIRRVLGGRPLKYMKITPAFFDIFEWAAREECDRIVNVETDLAFINPGFLEFLQRQMRDVDYLAPELRCRIPQVSLWPAYRTLAGERQELAEILGMSYLNRCFSPAQVFGRGYISAVLSSDIYPRIRAFVERNQQPQRSWTLQELLLPSLADSIGVTLRSYPAHMARFNRYRPHQAPLDLNTARTASDAYFIHPVRRNDDDPVRSHIKELVRNAPQLPTEPAES
jgi:hypothetical protein